MPTESFDVSTRAATCCWQTGGAISWRPPTHRGHMIESVAQQQEQVPLRPFAFPPKYTLNSSDGDRLQPNLSSVPFPSITRIRYLIIQRAKATWPLPHIQNGYKLFIFSLCLSHLATSKITADMIMTYPNTKPHYLSHVWLERSLQQRACPMSTAALLNRDWRCRGYPLCAKRDNNYTDGHSIKGGRAPTWLVTIKKKKIKKRKERGSAVN